MRLIDITNSYPHLVTQQLAHTDATYIKVYSLGNVTVIFTKAPTHDELLFTSDTRNIKDAEIAFALEKLCGVAFNDATVIRGDKLAEVTLRPKH
ncbi:DUF1827 family protein [Lacticaseibacillus parakribbianus]|uniref:DUF1827 family protein n=1 Tax=Lacticaseibacillus parakribbianus TaxID=2970927 RepID=UPI0021CAFE12|nr:DUF1827 family protein [Lacticaseibacillus parakribbianus]